MTTSVISQNHRFIFANSSLSNCFIIYIDAKSAKCFNFHISYNIFMLLSMSENKPLGKNAGVSAINTKGKRDIAEKLPLYRAIRRTADDVKQPEPLHPGSGCFF